MSTFEERPPRPAFGLYKRALVGALLIVLASAGAVSAAILLEVKDDVSIFVNAGRHNRIEGIDKSLAPIDPGGPQTILVAGSDHRWADRKTKSPPRSDTIMLIRLDPSKGATGVMNIPRDLKVTLPGHGTMKINESFSLGGPGGLVRAVHNLTGLSINHVVVVNFGGFSRAVNRLGCVYVDVDRHYYHSNVGLPPSQQYAEIDVPAGYQRLCGNDALQYVRYRHGDNDFIRSARQQDFLRQAKEQIGIGKLFGDRKKLLEIFGAYTQTDIHSNSAILRLLKLAFTSAKNPIQQITFRAGEENTETAAYVVASQDQINRTVQDFLNVKASKKPKPKINSEAKKRKKRRSKAAVAQFPGLVRSPMQVEDQGIKLQLKAHFPVYWPSLTLNTGRYSDTPTKDNPMEPRAYTITDRNGNHYRAYRMTVDAGGFGQYYGIQGTKWTGPPILDNPDDHIQMRGRRYDLFYDGRKLRIVSWRSGNASYWVSNTLSEALSNKQMLGIARSLTRVGR
jgi:LCP family protein required for cell wall assembly